MLNWITRWLIVSLSAALAFALFQSGDLSFLAEPTDFVDRTVRWFLSGLVFAVAWVLLDHTRHFLNEHFSHLPKGQKMHPGVRKHVLGVLARQILVIGLLLVVFEPLERAGKHGLLWLLQDVPSTDPEKSALGCWGPALAVALAAFVFSGAVLGGLSRIRTSVRIYGRRFPLAMLRMLHLRTMGPPRDFFWFVPVIADLPIIALGAFLWVDAPHPIAGGIAAASVISARVSITVSGILPPIWVFFSASQYFQFEVFRILRLRWAPRNGIALLNRFGQSHRAVYYSERQIMERLSPTMAAFYRDPTAPRVWSIRSRTQYWENVAYYLIRMCPLIVVDCRGGDSTPVVRELRSIQHYGLLHRTVLLTEKVGNVSDLHEILLEEGETDFAARAFTEEDLVLADWHKDDLHLPGTVISTR